MHQGIAFELLEQKAIFTADDSLTLNRDARDAQTKTPYLSEAGG